MATRLTLRALSHKEDRLSPGHRLCAGCAEPIITRQILLRPVIAPPLIRHPQLVYVTRRASAAGKAQALEHPIVHSYVGRENQREWVQKVVEDIVELTGQLKARKHTSKDRAPPASRTA